MNRPGAPEGTPTSQALRFATVFVGVTIVMAATYESAPALLGWLYLLPVTWVAWVLASIAGIGVTLDTVPLSSGFCELAVDDVTYTVSLACTGLFTCSLYIAACIAYPAPLRQQLAGIALGVPAFMTFGVLRLVFMICVALVAPERIEIFHTYIMTIANLGFALFVWVYWLAGPNRTDSSHN